MKKMFIAMLLVPVINAKSFNIDFDMQCKVTGQVLIKSVDGVATKYSSFSNGLQDGDIFNIEFTLNTVDEAYKRYTFTLDSMDDLNLLAYYSNEDAIAYRKDSITFKRPSVTTILSENEIINRGMFETTILKRYYKNDWHLMTTNNETVGEAHRTLTANCLNMPSGFDELILALKKLDVEKWKGSD